MAQTAEGELWITEGDALQSGMEEMAEEFRTTGGELYR